MTKKRIDRELTQNVGQDIAPIYQSLHPEWNDSTTLDRPLVARGDFSNAWVVYEEEELPRHVARPSALSPAPDRKKGE